MLLIALTAIALAAAHIAFTIVGTFFLVALLERLENRRRKSPNSPI
jgi:energy-converting hydrogenase Eha subunit C